MGIGECRKKQQISLDKLARKTRYTTRHLARIESGETSLTPQAAVIISEALDEPRILYECCAVCPVGCKLMEKKNPVLGETG